MRIWRLRRYTWPLTSPPTPTVDRYATCGHRDCDEPTVGITGTGVGGGCAVAFCADPDHHRWANEYVAIFRERANA